MTISSKEAPRPFRFSLSAQSGVPLYRQITDQVLAAIATGSLVPGDQLPTVRQVAVDLAINLNTVLRAYRELEIRGIVDTQQGTGTFVSEQQAPPSASERKRILRELTSELIARAGAQGFSAEDVIVSLREWLDEHTERRS